MILKKSEVEVTPMGEGVQRELFARGGKLMMTRVSIKKGKSGPMHAHPHEQITYVLSGRAELTLGDKKEILEAGDSYYAAPNVMHGVVAFEDTEIIEAFTPQREDFISEK